MNVEKILHLADVIEKAGTAATKIGRSRLGFNMSSWGSTHSVYSDRSGYRCGTVACIAGWQYAIDHRDVDAGDAAFNYDVDAGDAAFNYAKDVLDLPVDQAEKLFAPADVPDWHVITPAVAARVLRILAETGKVDWPAALASAA